MPPSDKAATLLSILLFMSYLGINLGALHLTAHTQQGSAPRRYLNSTAVTLSEVIKLCTSILVIYGSSSSTSAAAASIAHTVVGQPGQMLRVAVPALLYTIQNNVIYAALSHVDAVSFQITYQMKIVAALLSSRILLGKKASKTRWMSVLMLTLGVIVVQLALNEEKQEEESANQPRSSSDAATAGPSSGAGPSCSTDAGPSCSTDGSGTDEAGVGAAASSNNGKAPMPPPPASPPPAPPAPPADATPKKKRTLGLLGVLVACMCSGLAGAVMEKLLKGTTMPLAQRNLQVALISLVLASVHMCTNDKEALASGGFFQGYTPAVWAMVSLDSMGGLLVSMLLKYTSATLKNFAAPIGIILNVLSSRYSSSGSTRKPNSKFTLGTLLVLMALGLYTSTPG